MLLLGLGWLGLSYTDPTDPPRMPIAVELAAAVVAAVLVAAFRERRPMAVALLAAPATFLLTATMGASLVGVYAVASRRSWRATAVVVTWVAIVVAGVYRLAIPDTRTWIELTVLLVLMHAIAAAAGETVQSRRELVRSLRERARQAEEGQRLRIEEARHAERERIAREMHDVLAHRLSLLAVHAGALEFAADAAPEHRLAAGVVRQGSYEALEDLRAVLGLLRQGPEGERPQPRLADLPELADECRRAGASVDLDATVAGDVPEAVGRHAYRVVQEGLTNARKHAPGAPVSVTVAGDEAAGLTVEVRNPLTAGAAAVPGAGTGLVGLAERVRLLDGRLDHGPTADGSFRLTAWLPWRT